MRKLLGFTLIELLFVIAIIGVLVTLGMTMTKEQAQKTKIEKTALQMQQILQAGQSYYADNKCLPDDNSVDAPVNPKISGCNTDTPPAFSSYLPIGITVSSADLHPLGPWNNEYMWGTTADKSKFRVCTTAKDATSEYQIKFNQSVANRVASLLPNALALNWSSQESCGAIAASETCSAGSAANCVVASEVNKLGAGASSANPTQLGGYVLESGVREVNASDLDSTGQSAALEIPLTGKERCQVPYSLNMNVYPLIIKNPTAVNYTSRVIMPIYNFNIDGSPDCTSGGGCSAKVTFQKISLNCTGSAASCVSSALSPYDSHSGEAGALTLGYIASCVPVSN